jgi:hypothetical protein
VKVDPEAAALVGEPICVKLAGVVCSMVKTDVAGTSDVDEATGTVVNTTTVEGGGVEGPGADWSVVVGIDVDGTTDSIVVVGTKVDAIGVERRDVAGVDDDGRVVDRIFVDGTASVIVVPAAKVVTATCPLQVSVAGQHLLAPLLIKMHCSPASQ